MKRAEFHDRNQMLISVERDLAEEFKTLCDKERKSISLKFKELMEEEIQKNEIGHVNPISIEYISPHAKKSDNNTLDTYIQKGFITRNHFIEQFREKDIDTLDKYRALGTTISISAMAVSQYKRTGKYPAV